MKTSTFIFSLAFAFLTITCNGLEKINIENSNLSEIRAYVSKIDSDKTLAERVTEGIIEYDGKLGGFSIYYLFDKESKELFQVTENKATDTITNISFYYKNNKVVYVNAEKRLWKNDEYNELVEQEVYFLNEEVIKQVGRGQKPSQLLKVGNQHSSVHNENYKVEK